MKIPATINKVNIKSRIVRSLPVGFSIGDRVEKPNVTAKPVFFDPRFDGQARE